MSVVPAAHALSKRDTEKAAALDARMAAAEKRYRDALVLVNNSDPKGTAEGDAALEDMEDIIDACIKQRGCLVSNQLATYKRLLKTRADAEAPAAEDPEDDDTLLQADLTIWARRRTVFPRPRVPPRCSTTSATTSTRWCSTTRPCRPASGAGSLICARRC